jgi:hypothetical protein
MTFAVANLTSRADALNRLLAIHYRSLPMYLSNTRPWMRAGDEPAARALSHIVDDQKQRVERISDMLLDEGADIDAGAFPMAFTDTHDLSLDYLITELIDHQRRDIAAIDEIVRDAGEDVALRRLAEEALGAAQGHLQSLSELAPS